MQGVVVDDLGDGSDRTFGTGAYSDYSRMNGYPATQRLQGQGEGQRNAGRGIRRTTPTSQRQITDLR
jgi:hypothetical protein